MNIEFPVSFKDKYRIIRQPHGSKGPTFDEVYEVSGLSANFRWNEEGRKDPTEWLVSFSRKEGEGAYAITCSLSANWRDGGWFKTRFFDDEPIDWKITKVD